MYYVDKANQHNLQQYNLHKEILCILGTCFGYQLITLWKIMSKNLKIIQIYLYLLYIQMISYSQLN